MTAGSDIGNHIQGLQITTPSSSSSTSTSSVAVSEDKKQQSDEADTATPGSLELEVYVKLLCNPTLPVHIIQTTGTADHQKNVAATAASTAATTK